MSFPAGWYDDPQDPMQQRYWDGGFWTDYRRPREGPPPYQGQGFGYRPMVASTPDGVPLAGWWKRVGARILDGLIVAIGGLPLTGYFLYQAIGAFVDYEREIFDRASAGQTTGFNTALPWELYKWLIPATLISLVVSFGYEFFFLTRSGSTPGKKILGISVRLRDVAGPPPPLAVAKRYGFVAGLSLLGALPQVGSLIALVSLLDDLFPLWDDKKQALHDKVAATNVVLGPQPRRGESVF
jgi:uncharacterized RDD family membrane protein YckC